MPIEDPLPDRDPNVADISCECGYLGPADASLHCFTCDAVIGTVCPRCAKKTEARKCPKGCKPRYPPQPGEVRGL